MKLPQSDSSDPLLTDGKEESTKEKPPELLKCDKIIVEENPVEVKFEDPICIETVKSSVPGLQYFKPPE
jgi:hypothetical protein